MASGDSKTRSVSDDPDLWQARQFLARIGRISVSKLTGVARRTSAIGIGAGGFAVASAPRIDGGVAMSQAKRMSAAQALVPRLRLGTHFQHGSAVSSCGAVR